MAISFPPGLFLTGGTLVGPLHLGSNTLDGSAIAFTGGTLNGVVVGGVTPAAGSFTTLTGSANVSVGSGANNILTITPGSTTATATTFAAVGTGDLNFLTATSHNVLTLRDATSAANSVRITAGATGAGTTIQQSGDAAGTLKLGAGSGGTGGLVSLLTPATISGGVQFGKALTYTAGSAISGVTATGNSAVLWYNSSLSGTLNTGSGVPFLIQIADAFSGGTSNASIFSFTENLNAGYDGNRQSVNWVVNKTAAAATPAGPSGAGWLNTAFSIYQHIDVGDGGTAAAPYGQNTMFNPDLRVNTGDWVFSAINTEADLRVYAGTNTPQKVIHALHYGIGDGSHASPKTGDPTLAYQDSGLTIDASPSIGNGSGKGLTTIQFGSYTQDTPWDSTAGVGTSIMRTWLNCAGNLSAAQQVYIDYGFNLPEVYVRNNFIDNGLFRVDGPTGNIITGLATVAATSSGSSIDVTGVVAVSATVASGGSSAKVGAEIIDSQGGLWEVATLSGNAAATVTLKRAAAVTAAPANPVTCRMANSVTAVTLNITWSSARKTLALQPSGGDTVVGAQAAIATNSTAGFIAIPFCAGVPSGAPSNAAKGIAMVYDTTNHKLWAYDNGASAWKGVVLT